MTTIASAIAGAVLALQTQHAIAPTSTITTNRTSRLAVLSQRDLRSHRFHAALALSSQGHITGQVLRKNGTSVCEFTGFATQSCVTLAGCALDGTVCS